MNKLYIKQALILSITFFIPACGMMNLLKERAYKTYENMIVYRAGVCAIDATAIITSNIIFYSTYITCTQDWLEKKINNRLAHIENQLKASEKKCIRQIYKDFNVTKEEQIACKEFLEPFSRYEKEYLATAHEEIVNDPELIAEILPLLKELNIHPQGIKIEILTSPNSLLPSADATSEGLIARVGCSKDILTIQRVVSPPTIFIHPKGLKTLKNHPKALLGSELGHIVAQHATTMIEIAATIHHFGSKTSKELLAHYNSQKFASIEEIIKELSINSNYQKLCNIHEQQAEILYKNAEYACAIREHRSTDYYPNQLFLGHYAQLVEIDELHKLKERL